MQDMGTERYDRQREGQELNTYPNQAGGGPRDHGQTKHSKTKHKKQQNTEVKKTKTLVKNKWINRVGKPKTHFHMLAFRRERSDTLDSICSFRVFV